VEGANYPSRIVCTQPTAKTKKGGVNAYLWYIFLRSTKYGQCGNGTQESLQLSKENFIYNKFYLEIFLSHPHTHTCDDDKGCAKKGLLVRRKQSSITN